MLLLLLFRPPERAGTGIPVFLFLFLVLTPVFSLLLRLASGEQPIAAASPAVDTNGHLQELTNRHARE